jgi:hypothetical protein
MQERRFSSKAVVLGYSDSPEASRASSGLANIRIDTTMPSRIVHRFPFRSSISAAAPGPHPSLGDDHDLVAAFDELLGFVGPRADS